MIVVQDLHKNFRVPQKEGGLKGSLKALFSRQYQVKKALAGVDLTIQTGEILGLIGANGAGKTTLVKCLAGIIKASSGSISILGYDPWKRDNRLRRQLSLVMGQKAQLWWDLPAADSLLLLKEIYDVPEASFQEDVDFLTKTLNVSHELKVPVRRLSLGERMKMELIAALLHRPKVIFLDEPTIGLDLTAQKAVREFLLAYRARFQPIMILTSHYMEDIASLCERIAILRLGQKVYDGPLDAIQEQYGQQKRLKLQLESLPPDVDKLSQELGYSPAECALVERDGLALQFKLKRSLVPQITSQLLSRLPVHDFSLEEEDVGELIEAILRNGMQQRVRP